jgi:hypothetical protein
MGVDDRRITTGMRRRPGRARAWLHRLAGACGWLALVALAIWRLPESPPWRLPLPLGLLMLAIAVALVACALAWARLVDRRRRPPRPQTPPAPARSDRRPRVPV